MKLKSGKNKLDGWLMLAIAAIFVLIFSYLPTFQALILSLKSGKGANLKFSGFANYVRLFHDGTFWQTMGNTLFYAIIQIPIMLLFAVVIAVLLNNPKLKFRGVYRTCIFLPCVTSLVSYSILFKILFSVDGIVNKILLNLHITDKAILFTLDANWAKLTIIVALIWRYTGYFMIFFLSGLQNIDTQVYEAAEMDGANWRQTLFRVTLPQLKPIIFLTSIMALNNTLQLFDEVVNLTQGGPGNATRTISQYIYDLSFNYVPSYGYAAAISNIVLLIIMLITLVQKKVSGDAQ